MLGTALTFTAVLSTVLCAVALALVLSGNFLELIALPSSPTTTIAAMISVVAVPAICVQGLYIAALQGLLDAGGMARSRGLAIGLGTLAGLPLIIVWGIVGAAAAALLLAVSTAVALGARLRKLGLSPIRLARSRSAAISLLALGLASTASAVAHSGADVVTRSITISHLGASANGLLQAPLSVTALAQGVLLGSVGAISVAVIARARGVFQIRQELTRMIDFIVPFAALGFLILTALAPLVLHLLFSSEFIKAQPLFLPVSLFQYTVVIYWVIGSPLLAAGRAGLWLTLDLIGAVVKIALTWLLIPRLGIIGFPIALLLFALLHLALSLIAVRSALGISLPLSRLLTCALGAGAVILGGWLPGFGVLGILAAGLLGIGLCVWCYRTFRLHT
jgi:PST family polysaccharide transporter